ncbi:hypothetical protein ANOBCDAF_02249 [Pleomorphomonas sp. T1.2MG-36]|uniref:hypothetical protein n=1 Tax=Pleomorphomonas sp. T1.2MG-36 TaxID=3041167 RepID=UPI00247766F1|nr:hypothetical protein [Pleomorphomonas sp. T1.2MG-36]CAI9410414.1 hypothetical protein ANOBCDAF_02249 [Pleomorphomonas sp. T1.2MG-36]
MKTFAIAAVAVAAIALPSLASAAERTYFEPSDGTFVAGTLNAPAAASEDGSRYTQTISVYEPADDTFTTVKVSGTPVLATHDAVAAKATSVIRYYEPADDTFVEVPVGK